MSALLAPRAAVTGEDGAVLDIACCNCRCIWRCGNVRCLLVWHGLLV
jgi:hypothetical protein